MAWSIDGCAPPDPAVNWLNKVEPIPTMTASTSTLMPDDTTLPSTLLRDEGGLAEQAERE